MGYLESQSSQEYNAEGFTFQTNKEYQHRNITYIMEGKNNSIIETMPQYPTAFSRRSQNASSHMLKNQKFNFRKFEFPNEEPLIILQSQHYLNMKKE
jgi:hypothetical protein